MNAALRDVLAGLSGFEDLECGEDLRFTFLGQVIAEAEAVGDALTLDILCHPLDAGPLVEEYPFARPVAARVPEGWVRMVFLSAPGPEERSAVMEAFHSAMDRVSPDTGPEEDTEE